MKRPVTILLAVVCLAALAAAVAFLSGRGVETDLYSLANAQNGFDPEQSRYAGLSGAA